MRRIVGLAVVLGMLAWGQAAQADPITYDFSGVMADPSDPVLVF